MCKVLTSKHHIYCLSSYYRLKVFGVMVPLKTNCAISGTSVVDTRKCDGPLKNIVKPRQKTCNNYKKNHCLPNVIKTIKKSANKWSPSSRPRWKVVTLSSVPLF